MPSLRMLQDTVYLFNYIGEVNDVASYQKAVIRKCYCVISEGSSVNLAGNGTDPNNLSLLYIFDRTSVVTDDRGNALTYIPSESFDALTDKSGYWTIRDGPSRDYFTKVGKFADPRENPVIGFSHLTGGTPRMWHFEVKGA